MRGRYIGIDLSITGQHRAAVMEANGTFIGKSFSFDRSFTGFQRLLERALPKDDPDCPLTFVLVPTSKTWIPLSCFLIAKGYKVFSVNPRKASDLRKYYRKYVKSDSVDAEILAKLPLIDPENLYQVWLPDQIVGALKGYCKQRDKIMGSISGRKARIEAHFTSANLKLMEAFGQDKFTHVARALLRNYVDPFKIKRLGLSKLTRFLQKHCHGQMDPELPRRIFEASVDTTNIYEQFKDRLPFDYQQVQDEINIDLDLMEHEEQKVAFLEKRISELYHQIDPVEAMQSMSGIGPTVAANIWSIVGNVNRIPNGRAYACLCGYVPKKKQSSNRDLKGLPITKAAQGLLKKSYFMTAQTSRRYDVEDAAFYDRLMRRGLHHYQAMSALARRKAVRSFAVMKRIQEARDGLRDWDTVAFQHRDLDGNPITKQQARQIVLAKYPSKRMAKKMKERPHPQVSLSRQSSNSSNMKPGGPLPLGDLLNDIFAVSARQGEKEITSGMVQKTHMQLSKSIVDKSVKKSNGTGPKKPKKVLDST